MTTKVSVPVMEVLDLATWLSVNTNDLKTYIDTQTVPTPSGAGKLLTSTGANPGNFVWQTLIQNVPDPAGVGANRRAPLADAVGAVSWSTIREVPVPTTPDEDDYALLADGGLYSWKKRTPNTIFYKVFAHGADHSTLQSQGYSAGDIDWPQALVKPAGVRDSDWVVVSLIGGGGGGGFVFGTAYNDNIGFFVHGGHGGGFIEWVFPASLLAPRTVIYPGKGGLQTLYTVTHSYGAQEGIGGIDSIFEPAVAVGTSIANININGTNPALFTTASPHGLSNGQWIMINDIAQTGGSGYTIFNNVVYEVSNVSGSNFELKYLPGNTSVIPSVPSGSYTPNTGKVHLIQKNFLIGAGGPGGNYATNSYPYAIDTGGKAFGKSVIVSGVNSVTRAPNDSFFWSGAPASHSLYSAGNGAAVIASGLIDTFSVGNAGRSLWGGNGGYGSFPAGNRFYGNDGNFPGGGGASSGCFPTTGALRGGAGANGKVTVEIVRGEKPRGRFQQFSP